jgi:hypothetical protein
MKLRFKILSALFLGMAVMIGLIGLSHVSENITPEDEIFIRKIIGTDTTPAPEDFEAQIQLILKLQEAVFGAAPEEKPILRGYLREPKNLYETGYGYCGDRARTLLKALRLHGFNARFAALFAVEPGRHKWETFLTVSDAHNAISHALVEVETAKGWMVIDTRNHWIALTANQQPISLHGLQNGEYGQYKWSTLSKEDPWPLLKSPYYVVYGLYSRHGQFYPPFIKYLPDINWQSFMLNLTS